MSKIPLPPSIEGKVRDRSRADRVRVELSRPMAEWLLGLINKSMTGVEIDDPAFRGMYLVYRSIADQLAKIDKGAE